MVEGNPEAASRRLEMIKMREIGLSCAEIGRTFKISRERVRQIVLSLKKPSTKKPRQLFEILLSTGDAAKRLGVSRITVGRLANKGILEAHRVGIRGDRRFRYKDIEKYAGEMLTSTDVATLLGVSRSTVNRWADKGILKADRVRAKGVRRFRQEDIKKLLEPR